jgi:type IV secretion system protein VirB4
LIDLNLVPVALSFVGSSDKESLRRIGELEAEHGQGWSSRWLCERGLGDWADQLSGISRENIA